MRLLDHEPSPQRAAPGAGSSLRSFWLTLVILNAGLAAGGWVYANLHYVGPGDAVPIIAAFLVQSSVYLVPGFPKARSRVEKRLPQPWRLALVAAVVSLVPYLIYSLPTGVFAWQALIKLAPYCFGVAFLFVVAPARGNRFRWQDLLVLVALGAPMISGVTFFREIYLSPIPEAVPRLDILGKLMVVPLGATAFLSLRRLERVDFRILPVRADLEAGLKNFLLFLPFGVPLAILVRFVNWGPKPWDSWAYPFELLGTMLGTYVAVALAEEFAFRGIVQNLLAGSLRKPLLAQFIASVAFGLVHLPTRGFPNWQFALLSAFAGWFYGRAYAQQKSIVPAMVAHTLVVVTWRYGFSF